MASVVALMCGFALLALGVRDAFSGHPRAVLPIMLGFALIGGGFFVNRGKK
ncbi:sodium:neurotransmitter symporter [Streptomyces sp. NPDC096080]|uniref:sodium:neurotransmitter symporter n=1 Tax=Streptomyces sp. NPDC096080 TaxID=3156693 RepID=UPI0033224A02